MIGANENHAPADAAGLAASEAASQAVFNTAELLEHILSQLLPSQVIGAQRVCRQFRDIVATSPVLQQKVFSKLGSKSEPGQKWALARIGPYPRTTFTYKIALDQNAGDAKDTPQGFSVVSLNSALFRRAYCEPSTSKADCFRNRWHSGGEELRLRDVGLKKYIMKYMEGESQSWADLHVTNPPCRRASLFMSLHFTSDFGVSIWSNTVTDENGVTLRKLMDATLENVFFFNDGHPTGTVDDHPERSVRQIVSEYQKYYGTRGRIERMSIFLGGVVCPTESEREQFERGELCGKYYGA